MTVNSMFTLITHSYYSCHYWQPYLSRHFEAFVTGSSWLMVANPALYWFHFWCSVFKNFDFTIVIVIHQVLWQVNGLRLPGTPVSDQLLDNFVVIKSWESSSLDLELTNWYSIQILASLRLFTVRPDLRGSETCQTILSDWAWW